ncbi:hypothetical protein HYX18_04665 [Candidatus Woesearchaeota archaeon]|nr:hypothetical protein [Candidatus Woesearchaeota archaeon]
MKFKKFLVLIAILAIFLFLSILFFVNSFLLHSYKRIYFDFIVGNHLGFNPDKDFLHFGTLPRGAVGFRDFEVHNVDCTKCLVSIKSKLKWFRLDNNNFILKKNEKKTIVVFLNIPKDASLGDYSGFIEVYLWKTI